MPAVHTDESLAALLDSVAAAVAQAWALHRDHAHTDLRAAGERPGQYNLDLVTDAAALAVLRGAGVGVLSEESGLDDSGDAHVVVVDPVDGSTNASRGIPWYATSLCAVDEHGPRVALVTNLATGDRFTARRGGGAMLNGRPISVAATTTLSAALVVLNGVPSHHFGWRQYRALGATALDLCAVGAGSVDATIDCTTDALGPWDYLGGMLVLQEAGGAVCDVDDRDLVVLAPDARRTPVSACTQPLLDQALAARRSMQAATAGPSA